jgi:hypothetical protein
MHNLGTWIAADPFFARRPRPDGPTALVFGAGLALGLALGATVGAGSPRSQLQAASGGLSRARRLASRFIGGVGRPHDGNSVALVEPATSGAWPRPHESGVEPGTEAPDRTLAGA